MSILCTGRRCALRLAAASGVLCVVAAASGCVSTSWRPGDNYPRMTQTVLVATSSPPATVFVDGRNVGMTPIRVPLSYTAISETSTRDVTLWRSNPKLATALTVLTAGLYLPSSLFPISSESRVESRFENNSYHVQIEAEGFEPWDSTIAFQAEPEHPLDVSLEPVSASSDGGP